MGGIFALMGDGLDYGLDYGFPPDLVSVDDNGGGIAQPIVGREKGEEQWG